MTDLDRLHKTHSEAQIRLEIAQQQYNSAKQALIQELNKNGQQKEVKEEVKEEVTEDATRTL